MNSPRRRCRASLVILPGAMHVQPLSQVTSERWVSDRHEPASQSPDLRGISLALPNAFPVNNASFRQPDACTGQMDPTRAKSGICTVAHTDCANTHVIYLTICRQ